MENPQSVTPKQSAVPQPEALSPLAVMFPSPGMGHLIPMIEFAKRLVRHHNLPVTFVIPTDGPPSKAQTTVLRSLPHAISHMFLPPVTLSDLSPDSKIETTISLTIFRSLPSLRDALLSLMASHRIPALVLDIFCTDAIAIARELNLSPYFYFTSSSMALSFALHIPHLDQEVHCNYRDLPEPVKIPGCVPVHGRDLMEPVHDRKNEAYKWLLHHGKRFSLADGFIVNSFPDLEPEGFKELQKEKPGRPPVYPVGPLVNVDSVQSRVDGSECLKWLDEQPHGSVIFVCFGSGGTLSRAQIGELAHGLEMSEQRFLWVMKSPNDKVANATYFNVHSHGDPLDFLPKGFVERTRGRGLVVPSWAPQPQILSHGSTGGFLTHCGWNSILESVVNGVPLVAWPLFAEQKMNAVLVTEDIKVALRPKVGENGLVERHEIASVVKGIMESEEGKKLRYRMKDLKEAAARAIGENGSSTRQISELALEWKGETPARN